jgi:hypothetical protein
MTVEQHAEKLVRDAVERLKAQWGTQILTTADLTEAGDAERRLAATKARVADEISIQINMEINRK